METPLLEVTALQNLLVARATWHNENAATYMRLRKAVLAISEADPNKPESVATCASLAQFWQSIKGRFPTYADRRQFIWDSFRPLLQFVEHGDLDASSASNSDTPHRYYSELTGLNPLAKGLPLDDVIALYRRVHDRLVADGYFTEAFKFISTDTGFLNGKVADPELEILLVVRKRDLWPISDYAYGYSEDNFFDLLEFLYQHVSKPLRGTMHNGNFCGMHWHAVDKRAGRVEFRKRVNHVLDQYSDPYQLSASGEVLHLPEAGMEPILEALLPTKDQPVQERVAAAVLRYRRHGSSVDDRRQAVRDLADVLERLCPQIKAHLTWVNESDLFQNANNFGVRHFNDAQRIGYDAPLWLSWMFYFYLSSIHVVLRKIEGDVKLSPQKADGR